MKPWGQNNVIFVIIIIIIHTGNEIYYRLNTRDEIIIKNPIKCKIEYEWHPFTMSSSPFQEFMQFQIQAIGDWTDRALDLIEDIQGIQIEGTVSVSPSDLKSLSIRVEVPFGSSTRHFSDFSVVVLIGAGIGVTVS